MHDPKRDDTLRSGETPDEKEVPGKAPNPLTQSEVPVFRCVIHLKAIEGGGVRARVANLDGFDVQAASERDALVKIIPAFKKAVGRLLQRGESVPWIEPPLPCEQGESTRFVPVHL